MLFMRTTLDLPDTLFREVKSRAAKEGLKLKELIAHYIEAGLRNPPPPASQTGPYPIPVAIRRKSGEPLTPARSNAELHEILDKEDLANYRRVVES